MLIKNNNNNNNTHNNCNDRTKKGNTSLKMTFNLSARVVPKLLKAVKVECEHTTEMLMTSIPKRLDE